MNLSGFVGNGQVKKALETAFSTGRFPHAIIIQGETGCGKKTLAKILASALVCRDADNAPCLRCSSCVRTKAGSHPDIRVEQGSGATRSLNVETVKEIGEYVFRSPMESPCKVVVIHVQNTMNDAAQNKLLKLLEEPVAHVYFIITITSSLKLLQTVRSRTQIFTLFPPDVEICAEYVSDKLNIPVEDTRKIARQTRGNIAAALSLAQKEDEKTPTSLDLAQNVVRALMSSKEHELLRSAEPLAENPDIFKEVLDHLTLIFRDACACRMGGKGIFEAAGEETALLEGLAVKRLLRLSEIVQEYRIKPDSHVNMALLVTALCAKLKAVTGK